MLSIILPTYNRCEDLGEVLKCLHNQSVNGSVSYEILLVDNNSTDKTKEVVEQFAEKSDGRLRYVFEPQQGKSYALNTAIKEAKGDILVFTDDDVKLDKDWLKNINEFAQKNEFDAMGGRVLPEYPANSAAWIRNNSDLLCGPIVTYEYGDKNRDFNVKTMAPFIGANMVIKREVFNDVGLFNPEYGPGAGTFGEDTDIILRIAGAGKKLIYCPDVFVWHPVPADRMTLKYIAQWKMAAGRYYAADQYEKVKAQNVIFYFGVPRYLIKKVFESSSKLLFSVFNKRKFLENWNRIFISIGMMTKYRQIHIQNQCAKKKENNHASC